MDAVGRGFGEPVSVNLGGEAMGVSSGGWGSRVKSEIREPGSRSELSGFIVDIAGLSDSRVAARRCRMSWLL